MIRFIHYDLLQHNLTWFTNKKMADSLHTRLTEGGSSLMSLQFMHVQEGKSLWPVPTQRYHFKSKTGQFVFQMSFILMMKNASDPWTACCLLSASRRLECLPKRQTHLWSLLHCLNLSSAKFSSFLAGHTPGHLWQSFQQRVLWL